MNVQFKLVLGSVFCCFLSAHLHAYEISPLLSVRILGGQYFFQEQESNLAGNISLLYAPAIEVNDQWSFIPTLTSSWRGTKSVQDLVGGGTLFQQTQDHSFALKGIYGWRDWLLKAGGSYRIQLLKETNDESWGKGLYDFEKPAGNLEAEKVFDENHAFRFGYDIYTIDFRNFSSLESQQRDLGRENAGTRTLNTFNHALYSGGKLAFPFLWGQTARWEGSYYFTLRNYTDQKLVLVSGDLSSEKRADQVHTLTSNFTLPFDVMEQIKLLVDVNSSYLRSTSNQNNYDAGKTKFNENYYAYSDYSVNPSFNFVIGKKPWVASLSFNYVRRNYADRPVQESNGAYGSDAIRINEYYWNTSVSYPIDRHFRLQASGNFGWSRSNMKFEQTYRYNYETFAYLLGLVYDY